MSVLKNFTYKKENIIAHKAKNEKAPYGSNSFDVIVLAKITESEYFPENIGKFAVDWHQGCSMSRHVKDTAEQGLAKFNEFVALQK